MNAQRFTADALRNPHNRAILDQLPALALPDAWLVAGCLFQTVWNLQAGRTPDAGIRDYDLFYFDGSDLGEAAEAAVQQRVQAVFAARGIVIEAKNQARVHTWYRDWFGHDYAALHSTREGIDRFLVAHLRGTATRPRRPRGLRAVRPGCDLQRRTCAEPAVRPPGAVPAQGAGLCGPLAGAESDGSGDRRPTASRAAMTYKQTMRSNKSMVAAFLCGAALACTGLTSAEPVKVPLASDDGKGTLYVAPNVVPNETSAGTQGATVGMQRPDGSSLYGGMDTSSTRPSYSVGAKTGGDVSFSAGAESDGKDKKAVKAGVTIKY